VPRLPQHGAFAGSTMAPAASEPSRYPRRRSRVYLFPDWPQVREHPVPMGARFHFFEVPAVSKLRAALSSAGRPVFVRGGVKKDVKPTLGLQKGAPGVAVR